MKITRRTIKAQTIGELKNGTVFEFMGEFGEGDAEIYIKLDDGDYYLPHDENKKYAANLKTGSVYVFDNNIEVIVRDSELIIDYVEG